MADGILWQLVGGVGKDWVPQFQQGYDRGEQQAIKNNRRSVLEQLAIGPDGNLDAKAGLTQLIRSGDLQGAAQFAQTSKMLQPETTDEIKEYNLYLNQGGDKSFTDWKIKIKTASAPKINNVINTGDNQYAKSLAELNAKSDFDIQKSGQNATNAIATLNTMNRLLDNPNLYTGTGGDTMLRVKSMLKSAGVNIEGVPEAELFRALSNKTVLDATGGSLGVAISNADRDFLQQISPNLGNTPQGNKQIIDNAIKVEQRKMQIAQWAREYKARNKGQLDAGFQDYLAQKAEQNPLFPQAQTNQQQPQAQQRLAPPQIGEVRKGYRYKGGNPADQNSWEPAQ